MVEAARRAYKDYPTVVNEVPESKSSYNNTLADYARMDSMMQSAQKAIGGSSDSAQLAQSYMWTKIANGEFDDDYKTLYDDVVILAVLAQLAIDGCKKVFEINVNEEILRIRNQKCMNRDKDYPKFMKYTHKIPVTKNGKERPHEEIKKDRNRVSNRIDESLICPMNWMQERLEKIQGASTSEGTDIYSFMVEKPQKAKATNRQMSKIRKIVEDYDSFSKYLMGNNDYGDMNDARNDEDMSLLKDKSSEVYNIVSKMKINFATMYRLIEVSLEYDGHSIPRKRYSNATKYTIKTLNVLYRANRERFLSCFKRKND